MYDYIIVGAGSAGCVLANRLTENGDATVLLLEAGPRDYKKAIHIPAGFPKLYRTKYDWAYDTEPEPNAGNRRMFWPRGRVLGGSSSINAMIYIRGNRRNYDEWAAAGNTGWSFDECLPYFKKSENQVRGASEFHGVDGPLDVSDLADPHPLSRQFVAACDANGIKRVDDFNVAEQDGAGIHQVTHRARQRCSTAVAFLKPAERRRTLTIHTNAHALNIVLEGNRAVGVNYVHEGKEVVANAEREVILSAGAVNSPQLLLLSGIGPAEELKRVDVACKHDLPGVGKNLQDHLCVPVVSECLVRGTYDTADNPINIAKYLLFKRGPLASNLAEGGAFARLGTKPDLPELQVIFGPVYYVNHGFVPRPGDSYSLIPILLYPESRGDIRLRSYDPYDPPAIRANYLAADADAKTLLEGVKLCRQIANDKAFNGYRGKEFHPGPEQTSDAGLANFVRTYCETLYHPVGTCKMGHDDMAVVDDRLRVRGMEGLRVIDASIMPNIIGGNTNAPTIMIAEKAADLIKNGA